MNEKVMVNQYDWSTHLEQTILIGLHYSQKVTNHFAFWSCSSNMVCPIDRLLLESWRPFNSKHFDTSFKQIGQNI